MERIKENPTVSIFDILFNWLPAIILLLVFMFFISRRSRSFQGDYLQEMRKQTAIFERTSDALEKQGRA